jgi:hypothetical protein
VALEAPGVGEAPELIAHGHVFQQRAAQGKAGAEDVLVGVHEVEALAVALEEPLQAGGPQQVVAVQDDHHVAGAGLQAAQASRVLP